MQTTRSAAAKEINNDLASMHPAPPISKRILKHWQLYILILPTLVYFFIFKYIPMYGLQIAFREFRISDGFFGSPWVGLDHFRAFFQSYQAPRLIRNTILISVYSIAAGFPVPIILAVSINECRIRWFGKTVQMFTYAPYFISTVVMVTLIFQVLGSAGLLNNLLAVFGLESVYPFRNPRLIRSIYVWSGVWQQAGYAAVIYLAALSSVNPELYEAARIDGASTLQKIRNIDLPGIMPTIVILLILNTAQILNIGFEKIFLLQSPLNMEFSDVISTYVYRIGLVSAQFSYAAAIGFFQSVVSFGLLTITNMISRRVSETSLW